MVTKEKDEELALFLEMRRREKEKNNNFLLLSSYSIDHELNASLLGSNNNNNNTGSGSPLSKTIVPTTTRKTAADNFLNSEADKSDYEWLLTPPGTPIFPSLEKESQRTVTSQLGASTARPTALKQRLANVQEEPASRSNMASKNLNLSSGLNSSIISNRKPSSSGGPKSASRPATPTVRPMLPATSKPSRPSTPTSRATLLTAKPAAPPGRASTPTRSTARSSTPTARPSIPASKPASRAATPTHRPSNPSNALSVTAPSGRSSSVTRSGPPGRSSSVTRSGPPGRSSSVTRSGPPGRSSSVTRSGPPGRSSSVTKSGPTISKNPTPSLGTSPTVKPRPWKPSDMPGFSLDAPPNLRTSLPERPASASRGRPGAPSARSPSVEARSNGRPRQQSCSPSRGRPSNGSNHGNGASIPSVRRAHLKDADNVSPVLIGTKMVERVVNMRKLAPPKQDDRLSTHSMSGGKSSSLDSSGFGRSLSKKSLDMALRHMDIRRSISGNLRPIMTNIPASSMYSVRSGSTKSRTASFSDSPLATSSNASSELSVNNNFLCFDGSEMEDNDIVSEKGNASPASQCSR